MDNSKSRVFKIGLVGLGMFGGDVHSRTYADLVPYGIAPWLGRLGMEMFARPLADVDIQLVGMASRTQESGLRAQDEFAERTGEKVPIYYGDTPWRDMISANPDLDFLAVATPDDLHFQPVMDAINSGIHVIVEKPMVLHTKEADEIIALSKDKGVIVAIDMHKRYDPDHLKVFQELMASLGDPLYFRAILEEPLEVSMTTFKWAAQSDPFTYVGPHWVDLFLYYLGLKPIALTAVGQKKKLVAHGIKTYDAVQVEIILENGAHIHIQTNWITPKDFEGPVNQESEGLFTNGKYESDSQYRGLRYWIEGKGSRTSNTHFTRNVLRADGTQAYVGYGKDSIVSGMLAAMRVKFCSETAVQLEKTYPNATEARLVTAVIEAAKAVCDRNFAYHSHGSGGLVSAGFGKDGITIYDPYRKDNLHIYDMPI